MCGSIPAAHFFLHIFCKRDILRYNKRIMERDNYDCYLLPPVD